MAPDRLEALSALASAHLELVVRRALDSPSFELGRWGVRRLSEQGIINPDGLFIFSGTGQDQQGVQAWSVVLKVVQANSADLDPDHFWHWRREVSAMESGLLGQLPGPVVAPHCYGVEERPDGAWIWMEHIEDKSPRHWGEAEFAFAAEQLGQATGAWLASGIHRDDPWLCRRHARTLAEGASPTEAAWDNAYVQAAFPETLRRRLMVLWAERSRFYAALESLPQTFAHFDSHRRNLMIRAGQAGRDELVLVDWALCGFGPVGAEVATLLGCSLMLFDVEASDGPAMEEAVFPAYLSGLRAAGWAGNADNVRLAYDMTIALYCAVPSPALTVIWTQPDLAERYQQISGRDLERSVAGSAAMAAFALERGEAALSRL